MTASPPLPGEPTASPPLPGRLGDPPMHLRDDPGAAPRTVGALAGVGPDVPGPVPGAASETNRR